MNYSELIDFIKEHPDYDRVGMILCHHGVVRSTSRDGRKITALEIKVDHKKLHRILKNNRKKPGITEILVRINENKILSVGQDIMMLIVAGDIRDNVIPVLHDTLNAIKTTVTKKTEFFL